jgi:hypothetical protein
MVAVDIVCNLRRGTDTRTNGFPRGRGAQGEVSGDELGWSDGHGERQGCRPALRTDDVGNLHVVPVAQFPRSERWVDRVDDPERGTAGPLEPRQLEVAIDYSGAR